MKPKPREKLVEGIRGMKGKQRGEREVRVREGGTGRTVSRITMQVILPPRGTDTKKSRLASTDYPPFLFPGQPPSPSVQISKCISGYAQRAPMKTADPGFQVELIGSFDALCTTPISSLSSTFPSNLRAERIKYGFRAKSSPNWCTS